MGLGSGNASIYGYGTEVVTAYQSVYGSVFKENEMEKENLNQIEIKGEKIWDTN